MPSVKLQPDTLAILAGLRGRMGCGHSYDKIIQELVRRQIEGSVSAALAGDRLRRIEEMLTQLTLQKQAEPVAPTYKVE